ncbi:MAG: hypothetical protein Q8M22_10900 [Actinomycetota bacterium]|nr:hypothetical protein [Actinomycetota bacterium]
METGHPHPLSTTRLPGLTVAALASIGAGAVHGAATGIHAEHPRLAQLFVIITVAQLGAGIWALVRPMRPAALAVAAVNAVAVGGWLVTRLTGISWIPGLEVAEAPQFADTACALMGAVAVGSALSALLVGWRPAAPARVWMPSIAIAALAVPAMWTGGTHVHSHDESSEHAHDTTVDTDGNVVEVAHDDTDDHPHDTVVDGEGTVTTVHDDDGHHDEEDPVAAAGWPRPWDPALGIDLSGVPGVTVEQQLRADKLIEDTLRELPRWADTAAAIADGYTSIGDSVTGVEHYIKSSLIQDDVMLDPTQPESLVYEVDGDKRTLTGAMFIASDRPTDDPTLTAWAGPLMTWHNHGDLCWDLVDGVARVVGTTGETGTCARGVNTGGGSPMVHVWIAPHMCGPFAALEGIGAGQAAVPEAERMDKCREHDDHGATPAVTAKPYDPTQPIDLSGFEGVTPEQQAAAENLIAVTVVRLPQWSDYRVAEAAGFHSIGDAGTGHEHFVQWDWINDDIILDPDHPESLVYEPQPDGSKKLVSAMYMLPTSVALADVPDIGGPLMQWHIHDNLCYTNDPIAPRVAGLTDLNGNCNAPLVKHDPAPMIHVWITPHACGPFASLEGIGAGQIEAGEERLCDHAHGSG